uniref:Uncharacterized protein n=1 Tax=Anguilla anguilla TaxID=7936 RepID=A0A0E9RFT4_ANGAN
MMTSVCWFSIYNKETLTCPPNIWQFNFVSCRGHESLVLISRTINNIFENIFTLTLVLCQKN